MAVTTIDVSQRIESYLYSASYTTGNVNNGNNTLYYRVITRVTGVSNDTGGVPNLPEELFLLRKRGTGTEYISNSDYMRIANAEDFSLLDDDTATNVGIDRKSDGSYYTWEEIIDEGYTGTYIPASPHLATAASGTTESGYYVSDVLVKTYDNISDAQAHAENILIALDKFIERYNILVNAFETDNTSTYPNQYEEITYS